MGGTFVHDRDEEGEERASATCREDDVLWASLAFHRQSLLNRRRNSTRLSPRTGAASTPSTHLDRLRIFSPVRKQRTRLERRGEEDGERAGADDADDGEGGELKVALVLVAVSLELLGGVDGRVLVDVRLAVAEAELVDVASLAGAAVDDKGRGEERRSASGQREWIERFAQENLTRDLRKNPLLGFRAVRRGVCKDPGLHTHVLGAEPASVEPL